MCAEKSDFTNDTPSSLNKIGTASPKWEVTLRFRQEKTMTRYSAVL